MQYHSVAINVWQKKTPHFCYKGIQSVIIRSRWLKFVIHANSDSNPQWLCNNVHGFLLYDRGPETNSLKPTITLINGGVNHYQITPDSTSLDTTEYIFTKCKEV